MAINSKVPIHAVIFLMFFFLLPCFASGAQGRLEALYAQGAKTYDVNIFEGILQELDGIDYEGDINLMLLRGKSLYWIQQIYILLGENKRSGEYGDLAVEALTAVLKIEPDLFEAFAYRILVFQMLIPQRLKNVMKYGPMTFLQTARLEKMNSGHYLTSLIKAVNYLRAPRIGGGNKKKALKSFCALVAEYPDIEELKVNLAEAYYLAGDKEKCFCLLEEVLEENEHNLFALKVKENLDKRERE